MANTDLSGLTAHPLSAAHIAGGLALSQAAGWNQNAADWDLFMRAGRGFGLSTNADPAQLVATTMIVPFGARFAWISVVLVAADHRRRGLATHLTMEALTELADTGQAPILDATPQGREVYRRLGFTDAWLLQRLLLKTPPVKIPAPPPDGIDIRPIDANTEDWDRIAAYDAPIFGADRRSILKAMVDRLPSAALVAERKGAIVGLLLGRDGRVADQLGPLSADSVEIALALLGQALTTSTKPVFIDLPERHGAVRDWLTKVGFAVGRPFSRMVLGMADTYDDHARLILSAGPEFG